MNPDRTFAHSGKSSDRSDWQTLAEHLGQTAELAASTASIFGLSETARIAGKYHDFGKHDPAFDRILMGDNIRVDHSTAGGKFFVDRAERHERLAAEILAYAILGHHAGLPDKIGSSASLMHRIDNHRDNIAPEVYSAAGTDLGPVLKELSQKIRNLTPGFDLSVAGRMVFSCLVDADFRDTEAFYDRLEGRRTDRSWPALASILHDFRGAFDAHIGGISADTDLNRMRGEILEQVRAAAVQAPGLFSLTVPTGGGKTLASMGFALDHALCHGHRRIIYAIPYTSIIDQTATIFRGLFDDFGDVVLEHHSSIDEDGPGREARQKLRLAMEDWAAPIIVTTNVQLFESLFAARPSRCRKLHNIAGSVIVLDEAQCLPRSLLIPVLRMIDTLSAHFGCTIVLCTATQPAFDSRQLRAGGLALAERELAADPPDLSRRLRRAKIVHGGEMEDSDLVCALSETPQGVVIVNSRKHALELYQTARDEGLDGAIHLSTRQYPVHRRLIIDDIRNRLSAGQPCRLIATSLIEAGVDLDFPLGWRAEAGLDSIVQAAGRVNREGKRPLQSSRLTVFSAPGQPVPRGLQPLIEAMRSTAKRHPDLLAQEAILDWFEQVYWTIGPERMGQPMVDAFAASTSGTDFPYRSTALDFRMIEETMVSVIVAVEDIARTEVDRLSDPGISSGSIARALQPFTVQVPKQARDQMLANGHASYYAPRLRGNQFCLLEGTSLYRSDTGLLWENAEYLETSIC